MQKLLEQQKNKDKAGEREGLNATAKACVEGKKLEKRHIERLQKKFAKLNKFLDTHKEGKSGANGQPVQNNIIDEESAKIKGPHGNI